MYSKFSLPKQITQAAIDKNKLLFETLIRENLLSQNEIISLIKSLTLGITNDNIEIDYFHIGVKLLELSEETTTLIRNQLSESEQQKYFPTTKMMTREETIIRLDTFSEQEEHSSDFDNIIVDDNLISAEEENDYALEILMNSVDTMSIDELRNMIECWEKPISFWEKARQFTAEPAVDALFAEKISPMPKISNTITTNYSAPSSFNSPIHTSIKVGKKKNESFKKDSSSKPTKKNNFYHYR